MESDTEAEQYDAVQTVFEMLKMQTDVDMEKDMVEVFMMFQKE